MMRYWVEQEQCIPGFLASVTLECYEKNKMEREQEERDRIRAEAALREAEQRAREEVSLSHRRRYLLPY